MIVWLSYRERNAGCSAEFQQSGRKAHQKFPLFALSSACNIAAPQHLPPEPQWLRVDGDFSYADQHVHKDEPILLGGGGGPVHDGPGPPGLAQTLVGMGFPAARCRKALQAGVQDAEAGVMWLCEHAEDEGIDEEEEEKEQQRHDAEREKGREASVAAEEEFVYCEVFFGSDMARLAPADPSAPAACWVAAVDVETSRALVALCVLLPAVDEQGTDTQVSQLQHGHGYMSRIFMIQEWIL